MGTTVVVIVGVVLLVWIAVTIGASMDTEAQRRAAQQLAEERRAARSDRLRRPLCDECPFRRRDDVA